MRPGQDVLALIASRGSAFGLFLLLLSNTFTGSENAPFRVVDLAIGESSEIDLSNGKKVKIKLLALEEARDEVCRAVRSAHVKVDVNGQTVTLVSATYHLPVTVGGVQIDCPITKGYNQDSRTGAWGLDKDARLRIWPAGASWLPPGTF